MNIEVYVSRINIEVYDSRLNIVLICVCNLCKRFRDSEMDTIYRILSAILNLLRIEFKATLTENNTDGSIIINKKGGEGPVQVSFQFTLS